MRLNAKLDERRTSLHGRLVPALTGPHIALLVLRGHLDGVLLTAPPQCLEHAVRGRPELALHFDVLCAAGHVRTRFPVPFLPVVVSCDAMEHEYERERDASYIAGQRF